MVKSIRLLPLVLVFALAGCKETLPNSNRGLVLEYYKPFVNEDLTINSVIVRGLIDSLMRNDSDRHTADLHTRKYYRNEGDFLWITRHGVDERADSLLSYLRTVEDMGFDKRKFYVDEINHDLQLLRNLELGGENPTVNKVLARLEYRLTKSFLRYAVGQRFGFMNPTYVLNRIDTLAPNPYDSIRRPVRYRGLFDVKMAHADDSFYALAFRQVRNDSVASFLHSVQPVNPVYYQLKQQLAKYMMAGNLSKAMRAKLICNMERCRWRQEDNPWQHQKYVMVNIPSFHLWAVDHKDTLSMRIGCGADKTKTPLLNSRIHLMQLNPDWYMPRSIILHDMVHHLGNHAYFKARNYYVREVSTGKEVELGSVNRAMLLSGAYGVAQRGGKGNALGRIIFRFDNNFSVYLHDTNSKGVFGREDRGVSHGCIRVEKPYDLAVFLLADKKQKLMDQIRYSMMADSLADKKLTIKSVKVNPQVPLFIAYYTLYPMAGGRMVEYPDVYGYDKVIYGMLKKYL